MPVRPSHRRGRFNQSHRPLFTPPDDNAGVTVKVLTSTEFRDACDLTRPDPDSPIEGKNQPRVRPSKSQARKFRRKLGTAYAAKTKGAA
jgi:hypothetical protein